MAKIQTVLITGATGGIGYEISKLFARDHYKMVIVGKEPATLHNVSEVLKTIGSPGVITICKDLSNPKAADEIFAETTRLGLSIDILVNDAGIGQHGKFMEVPVEKDMEIIYLNIVSLVKLTKFYLKQMKQNNSGKILQLSSIVPSPPENIAAVYAATKAFVLSLTDSLVNELKGTNISVTALIPGQTGSYQAASSPFADESEDPATAARLGYQALFEGQHHATSPGLKPTIAISSLVPSGSVAGIAKKQLSAFKKNKTANS